MFSISIAQFGSTRTCYCVFCFAKVMAYVMGSIKINSKGRTFFNGKPLSSDMIVDKYMQGKDFTETSRGLGIAL